MTALLGTSSVEAAEDDDSEDDGKSDDDSEDEGESDEDDDDDGDGYANNQGDCDDTDPAINPDAQEVCDGVDNNCDGQIDEPVILFTSPVDGSTIDLSSTLVTGTIYTCSQEVGIVVNGVLVMMAGNEFAANDIPLEIGVNTLTAVATDEDGRTATDTITVYTNVYQDQVNLSANITSGLSSLDVTFLIDTQIINQITTYEMDFEGDGVIDEPPIADLDNISFTYNLEGLYYPTITVTDDQGYWYTDTIAINVLSLDKMDALLKAKWNGMKDVLRIGDIDGALSFIAEESRERYHGLYTTLSSELSQIDSILTDIQLIAVRRNEAEFAMLRTSTDGVERSFYVLFVRDNDGIWRLRTF